MGMATCAGCGVRLRSDTTTGRHKCVRRAALRVRGCEHGLEGPHSVLVETKGDVELWDMCDGCRLVSDADLASLGYVKLDGIDMSILEGYAEGRLDYFGGEYGVAVADVLSELAMRVLAAIDGGQE